MKCKFILFWLLCATWGVATAVMHHSWHSPENVLGNLCIIFAFIIGNL